MEQGGEFFVIGTTTTNMRSDTTTTSKTRQKSVLMHHQRSEATHIGFPTRENWCQALVIKRMHIYVRKIYSAEHASDMRQRQQATHDKGQC